MDRKEKLRLKGIVPQTIYIDTLKDEKRTIKKLHSLGGTRIFCNSPLDQTIEFRRNFIHYIAASMKHRHDLGHAVGINPLGPEWSQLAKALLRKNSRVFTIDYSNFGPGYNSEVASRCYDMWIKWSLENVKGLNELELQCLAHEVIQSVHICGNTVYNQLAGSPSGAVPTTIINSDVNKYYLLWAFYMFFGKELASLGLSVAQEYKMFVFVYMGTTQLWL